MSSKKSQKSPTKSKDMDSKLRKKSLKIRKSSSKKDTKEPPNNSIQISIEKLPSPKPPQSDDSNLGDLFANMGNIVLEVTEEIPEYQRVYRDEAVYRQELENQLLSDLPVYQQSSAYWQKRITRRVDELLELYRQGLDIMAKGGLNYYKLIDQYLHYNFSQSWIIPIIYDIKKIYRKINEDRVVDLETPESDYISETVLPVEGVKLVDQKKELLELSNLNRALRKKEFNLPRYYQLVQNLTTPYLFTPGPNGPKSPIGHHFHLTDYTQLLRFFNADNQAWEQRVGEGPLFIESKDEDEKDPLKSIRSKKAVDGEKVNLVGFMVLPRRKHSIYSLLPKGSQDKLGLVGDITDIGRDKNAIITLPNHGLPNNAIVVLSDSDTIPNLDGEYQITLLDDNRFTIPRNFSNGKVIAMGKILSVRPLPFEKRILYRQGQDFAVYQVNADGKRGKVISKPEAINNETAYFYQIDNQSVLQDDYAKILDLVIPQLEQILEIEKDKLDSETMLDGLNKILELYGLSLEDLTAEEIESWRKLLAKNVQKELETTNASRKIAEFGLPPLSEESETEKGLMENPLFVLADSYFFSADTIEKYGLYPLKGSDRDTPDARMTWLRESADRGSYYLTQVNEKIQNEEKKSLMNQLETTLKALEKDLKTQSTILQKESKVHKYFLKSCASKTTPEFNSLKELEEASENDYEEGTRALVKPAKPEKGQNPSLYEWKNKAWQLIGETSFFDYSQYCFFGDKNIDNLEEKDLECSYDSKTGCQSARVNRIEKRISGIEAAIDNYQQQISYWKKDELSDAISKKVDRYLSILELAKHSGFTKSKKEKKDDPATKDKKKPKDVLVKDKGQVLLKSQDVSYSVIQIFNKILQVSNDNNRRYLIYKLIDRDGLLVGNFIYSRKYESKLLCGHWYFQRLEEQTDDNEKKDRLRQRLLNQFGDGGKADKGFESCKICGNYLDDAPYDDVEGFDKEGHLIRSRQVLEEDNELDDEGDVKIDNPQTYCQSIGFKTEMEKSGVAVDTSLMALCDILHSFLLKLNISMFKSHLKQILLDVIPMVQRIVGYEKYKRVEIINLQKRELSLQRINLLNERGYFTDKYQNYVQSKKYISIAVRLLITLQTSVPPYIISKPQTNCTLTGIDGEAGNNFFMCLLEEMEVFDIKLKKKDIATFRDNLRKHFQEMLNEFHQRKNIKTLYDEREAYLKKMTKVNKDEVLIEANMMKVVEIGKLAKSQLSNPNLVLRRIKYLSMKIRELVNKKVKEVGQIRNPLIMENTCCYMDVKEYGSYYNFVNPKAQEYLDEIIDLATISKTFLNKGVVFRRLWKADISEGTINAIPFLITNKDDDKTIITKYFMKYCSTGESKGQLHVTIDGACLKCSKKLKDIESTDYSIKDMDALMMEVSRQNFTLQTIKELYPEMYLKFQKDIDEGDLGNLNVFVRAFVDKLAKVMIQKGDKKFVEKYSNLILNLGNLNEIYDEKISQLKKSGVSNKEIEKRVTQICNQSDYQRIALVKKYFNSYFRKSISYIQNNVNPEKMKIDVEALGIPKSLAEDLQGMIYQENLKYSAFMKRCQYFQELKFDYTADEINNLFGYEDRYNCSRSAVIEKSPFALKDASHLLIYLLVTQLNKFISNIPGGQDKKSYCQVVVDYILTVLDEIDEETSYLNISEGALMNYELVIKAETERPSKSEQQINEWEFVFGRYQEQVEEEKESADVNMDLVKQNQEDDIVSKIKSDYKKKFGDDPDGETLSTLKDEYMKEMSYQTEEIDTDYDLLQPKEGLEVLEIGDDYGELAQGMETEGDGISDYSMDVL